MQGDTQGAVPSGSQLWTGRVLSGLGVAFLVMDAVMKLMKVQPVLDTFPKVGWPISLVTPLGIILLVCTTIYVVPQTSVLGAVLLTGYLGGAVATHLRVGDPLFSHVLFPTYIALLLWGGLFLREQRLRALLPLRS
jgi:DoxX-like family